MFKYIREDIKNIVATGVEGVSIISAISYSENIKQTVEQMINEYKNYVGQEKNMC